MPHTLHHDVEHALIEVRYRGRVDCAEREHAIQDVGERLSRLQVGRLLVNLRAAELADEPTHVRAALANAMAHAMTVFRCRLAYLVAADQEANRIVENMATARDMPVARFHEREAAIAWLLQDRDRAAATDAPADGLA